MPEGSVGIGGGDVAGGAVELADVLGEVPTVCMPSAADLDGQRTGGYGLGRVPGEQPQAGMMTTGEVHASNLQVAAVEITMVECYAAVGCYLLVGASPLAVVPRTWAVSKQLVKMIILCGNVGKELAYRPEVKINRNFDYLLDKRAKMPMIFQKGDKIC